jgi:hypothetical protein
MVFGMSDYSVSSKLLAKRRKKSPWSNPIVLICAVIFLAAVVVGSIIAVDEYHIRRGKQLQKEAVEELQTELKHTFKKHGMFQGDD